MNHPLIESHPNGIFPVLEVAKAIDMDATAIRRKASNMNGQLNFDRDEDTLTVEQLRVLLPTYITGARQLRGKKRKAVESLLTDIGGADNTPVHHPNNRADNRANKARITPQTTPEQSPDNTPDNEPDNTPVNHLKNSFLTRQNFLLGVVGGLVFVQSSHFTLYYIDRIGEDGLTPGFTIIYGVLIGLLVEAMGLILVANGRGRLWLAVIAAVSFSVNILFYEAYNETGWNLFGEIILSLIIPGCIYLVSELYVDKSQQ